jgi:ectoine hydroxylase-related dioxygenase (phytanoyl-CoA dioxygenase family)
MSLSYKGCTTKSLHRLNILNDKLNSDNIASETPSLVETKVAEVKLPSPIAVPIITQEDITLTKEEATVDAILDILKKYGVCRIKKLFSAAEIDQINTDLDPFFKEKENDPRLFPKETIRVTEAVSKSPQVVNKIMSHPLNLQLAHKVLDQSNVFWIGNNLNVGYCPAIVSSSIGFQVSPGADFQALHRDDQSDHNIRKVQTPETFDFNLETQIGFSVALTRTVKENGATRFIPGSHLWDHLQKPNVNDCIYNEMEKGDATFMFASVLHSASANVTKDEVRRIIILFMGRGNFRQKENIFMNCNIDYYKQFTTDQLKRLGFGMSEPYSNMIELQDPLTFVKSDYKRTTNYSEIFKVVEK